MTTKAQLGQWQVEGDTPNAYERYLVPAIFREGAEKLVAHAFLSTGEQVLDLGCGTGIVARVAADELGGGKTVLGIDLTPGMLEAAQSVSADTHPDITWQQGQAEDLPLARSSFDVVLSQQAFQFFEDRDAALKEIHRVLRPGGRMVLSVLRSTEHNHTYKPLIEAFRRHGGDDLGTMMNSPFREWSIQDLREMVERAGFSDVSVTVSLITARFPSIPDFIQQELSSSPMSELVSTMDDETREAITRDTSAGLSAYVDDQGLVHPLQTYLISARA
jgi:ubiquinone/menaquinone biosynthesis C-methylase UbiE